MIKYILLSPFYFTGLLLMVFSRLIRAIAYKLLWEQEAARHEWKHIFFIDRTQK